MIYATLDGIRYEATVEPPRQWAPVSVIIPQAGSVALGQLAVDALRRFTPEAPAIWVSHDVRDPGVRGVDGVVQSLTPVDRWWQRRRAVAGYAAGVAYTLAVEAMRANPPEYVMFMHNDALPLTAWWLAYLLEQARGHGGIAGVKRTEQTHAAHSSGVLMAWTIVGSLPRDGLMANLPWWDIVEYPSVRQGAFTARSACLRAGRPLDHALRATLPYWLEGFACDVSWAEAEAGPFWVHLGGGTVNRRRDLSRWVAAARGALGL